MRILVADDQDSCRRLLQDMFIAEPRISLTMACEGSEAWWLLTEPGEVFDLCIFDIAMPVVDGLTLIERIRAIPAFRRLPIILCTGTSDRETVSRAGRLAITQYVVKPYLAEAMRAKIRAALSGNPRFDNSLIPV